MPAAAPAVTAFDVDGTLTWTDTYLLFLRAWAGRAGFAARMAALGPAAALEKPGLISRNALKAASVRAFFAGADAARFAARADWFGRHVIAPCLLRADGRAAVAAAKARGAGPVVLVSASLEDYLRPVAQALGADGVLATRLERGPDGRLTGAIAGRNCRAEEKLARLHAAFGPQMRLVAAYGDTSGDHAMLAAAETASYRAFTDRPADALGRLAGLYLGGGLSAGE